MRRPVATVEAGLPVLETADGCQRPCPVWVSPARPRALPGAGGRLPGDTTNYNSGGKMPSSAPGRCWSAGGQGTWQRGERHSVPGGALPAGHHWAADHTQPALPSTGTPGDLVAAGLGGRLQSLGAPGWPVCSRSPESSPWASSHTTHTSLLPSLVLPAAPPRDTHPSPCPLVHPSVPSSPSPPLCPRRDSVYCQISPAPQCPAVAPSTRKPSWGSLAPP